MSIPLKNPLRFRRSGPFRSSRFRRVGTDQVEFVTFEEFPFDLFSGFEADGDSQGYGDKQVGSFLRKKSRGRCSMRRDLR